MLGSLVPNFGCLNAKPFWNPKDRSTGGDCVHQQFIEQCDLMLLLGGAPGSRLNVAPFYTWPFHAPWCGGEIFGPFQNHDRYDRHWMSGWQKQKQSDQTCTPPQGFFRGMSTIHGNSSMLGMVLNHPRLQVYNCLVVSSNHGGVRKHDTYCFFWLTFDSTQTTPEFWGNSSDPGMFDCLCWMTPFSLVRPLVLQLLWCQLWWEWFFCFVPVDFCRYFFTADRQIPQEKLDLSEREKPKDIFTVNEPVSIYLLPITSHILKHIHIYVYLHLFLNIYIYIHILYLFLLWDIFIWIVFWNVCMYIF